MGFREQVNLQVDNSQEFKDELARYQKKITKLRKEEKTLSDSIAKLGEDKEAQEKSIKRERTVFNKDIAMQTSALSRRAEELEEINANLNNREKSLDKRGKKIDAKTLENKESTNALKEQIEALNNAKKSLDGEKASHAKVVSTDLDLISRKKKELSDLVDESNKKLEEVEKAKQVIVTSTQKEVKAKKELLQVEKDIDVKKASIEELVAKNEALVEKLSSFEEEKAKIAEAQAKNEALSLSIQNAQRDLETRENEIDLKDKILTNKEKDINKQEQLARKALKNATKGVK